MPKYIKTAIACHSKMEVVLGKPTLGQPIEAFTERRQVSNSHVKIEENLKMNSLTFFKG